VTAAPATEELVVLVDRDGSPVGERPKTDVHSTTTPLHLAFSLHVFDADGRVLVTRRALTKATWPGVWTNSCCGHPGVGEGMEGAVRRRLDHELGLIVGRLTCVLPEFAYRARDPSGIEENEICPVFTADLVHPNAVLRPNPQEVMDFAWVDWSDLVTAAAATPFAFSPWAVTQLAELQDHP
jgi:isopentenyl-diphosphate delta-isomerase